MGLDARLAQGAEAIIERYVGDRNRDVHRWMRHWLPVDLSLLRKRLRDQSQPRCEQAALLRLILSFKRTRYIIL